jgi:hypothetical protein
LHYCARNKQVLEIKLKSKLENVFCFFVFFSKKKEEKWKKRKKEEEKKKRSAKQKHQPTFTLSVVTAAVWYILSVPCVTDDT